MQEDFEVGDTVAWDSARGAMEGIVVRILNRWHPLTPRQVADSEFPTLTRLFNGNSFFCNVRRAYLVNVKDAELHMPHPTVLRRSITKKEED